jgi:hypothetical protein
VDADPAQAPAVGADPVPAFLGRPGGPEARRDRRHAHGLVVASVGVGEERDGIRETCPQVGQRAGKLAVELGAVDNDERPRAASGEFLAILDADDLYASERLEALAELAVARPDLDVLTTDALLELDGRAVRRCYMD